MEFIGIVSVAGAVPQIAEFKGIVGLVVVHGPAVQCHRAQAQGKQRRQQHPQGEAPRHLAGQPYTSTSVYSL